MTCIEKERGTWNLKEAGGRNGAERMRTEEKILECKNGQKLQIRTLSEADAEAALEHLRITYGETEYLSQYADEIELTPEDERTFLSHMEMDEQALMLGGFVNGELAATASILPISNRDRMRHRGGVGMSVKKAYWGQGIGRTIFETLLEEAKRAGLEQAELEVVSENGRALKLYESCGFVPYGVRKKGIKLRDGRYFDEILMQKELRA